jgi:hypothetical protein
MERFPYFIATSKAVASGISPAGSFAKPLGWRRQTAPAKYWEPLKTSLCSFLEFPTLFFYLKEGVLSTSYMLFFATPSFITKFCVS